MNIGDIVTIPLDMTQAQIETATGKIIVLGKRYVVIECENGDTHCSNRLNAKAA